MTCLTDDWFHGLKLWNKLEGEFYGRYKSKLLRMGDESRGLRFQEFTGVWLNFRRGKGSWGQPWLESP